MATDYVLPTVSFQSPKLRLRIVLSYWLVFILGLPLWWVTTSIERLALPVERVRSTGSAPELRFPLNIRVEAAVGRGSAGSPNLSDVVRQVGVLLEIEKKNNHRAWQGLDIDVQGERHAEVGASSYRVEIHPNPPASDGGQTSLWLTDRTLHVRYDISKDDSSTVSSVLASALSRLLVSHATIQGQNSQDHLVVRYAPKYRLAFSLLNEDASFGDAVLGWDLEAAIRHYLAPILSPLGSLHNFTIESQVQFHAPLAFTPPSSISPTEERHYLLGEEELKMFINSADWTLASSVSDDPVLHFIVFIPSPSRRPLTVQTPTGTYSNAFIVPQWGGVVIFDPSVLHGGGKPLDSIRLSTTDMANTFHTFRSQLLTLLGIPSLPPSISTGPSLSSSPKSHQLSDWQLDALLRRRALENIRDSKEALSSIVKLVDQIENMPVGQDVKGDVQGALDAIQQVYSSVIDSPQSTLQHSARANTLSSRAFFNPGMLALLYFPAEHKYAVYIPLFAPVSVPLVVAAIREIIRWRQERALGRQKAD